MNLIDERRIIQRGLLFYWNCKVCKALGWQCEEDQDRSKCNFRVYENLKKHFAEFAKQGIR